MTALAARSEKVYSTDEVVAVIDEVFARWQSERPRPAHLEKGLSVSVP